LLWASSACGWLHQHWCSSEVLHTAMFCRLCLSHTPASGVCLWLRLHLQFDYYGAPTPLRSVANVNTPEATLLVIQVCVCVHAEMVPWWICMCELNWSELALQFVAMVAG
jgi:hypothetical protein